jgi:hypothetical protein
MWAPPPCRAVASVQSCRRDQYASRGDVGQEWKGLLDGVEDDEQRALLVAVAVAANCPVETFARMALVEDFLFHTVFSAGQSCGADLIVFPAVAGRLERFLAGVAVCVLPTTRTAPSVFACAALRRLPVRL